MAPPFGLFKRDKGKDRDKEGADLPSMQGDSGLITVSDVQKLLEQVESQEVARLCSKLEPIRGSVLSSLDLLTKIAEGMEDEKIKLEDVENRFKSVVENSKKTLVSSLRRESSSELPELRSINDVKKFRERLETMMNRIGEVSGSHSKVLNVFMKKHANKMKGEFEVLSSLLKETRAILSDYERDHEPLVRCGNLLNTISQKSSSIKSTKASIESTNATLSNLQSELEHFRQEIQNTESSEEYTNAIEIASKLKQAENEQAEFRKEILDLFAHVSRAITKYSYGVTKETASRLYTLAEEPWTVFESDEISPYSALLEEIKKGIESDRIQLKDREKVLHYLGDILSSIPQLKKKSDDIRSRSKSLSEHKERNLVSRAEKLRETITQYEEEIERNKHMLEQARLEERDKHNEIGDLLKQVESCVFDISQKNYRIVLDHE